jgi:hypothetical protein
MDALEQLREQTGRHNASRLSEVSTITLFKLYGRTLFSTNEELVFISPRTVEKHLVQPLSEGGTKNRLRLFNLLRSDAL